MALGNRWRLKQHNGGLACGKKMKFPIELGQPGVIAVSAPEEIVTSALDLFNALSSSCSTKMGYGSYANTFAKKHSEREQRKATIEFNYKSSHAHNITLFPPADNLMKWCQKEVEEKSGIILISL